MANRANPAMGVGTWLLQDTVVALQALSLYGASTYAKSGAASKVSLQSGGDFQQDFHVDPSNRLLLQHVALPQVPGEYSIEVSGKGCVYLQVRVVGKVLSWEGSPFSGRSQGEGRRDKGEGDECNGELRERPEKSRAVWRMEREGKRERAVSVGEL